ncbi:MAG: precorrin-6A/cobalt-precorrin-6A reductase, partial [Lentisphaerae bacterium]|nr:precorrin-6A/cobalt-precorrin-6A reductase [Lentisphaerota bacterium]
GPFSLEENRALIRRFGVGVLVTKDSGAAGGFQAKQEAARLEGCLLVVVGRAEQPRETRGKLSGRVFNNPRALVQAVLAAVLKEGVP